MAGVILGGCLGQPAELSTGRSDAYVGATPVTPTPFAGAPLAAFFHVRGVPATAERDLEVVVHGEDASLGGMEFRFEAGEAVLAAEAIGPGLYAATVNEVACDGTMNLVAESETDAVLLWSVEACTLWPEGDHPAGGVHTSSSIAGSVPNDFVGRAVVSIVSRDVPPKPVPDPIQVDEGGHFAFPSLQSGQYRLTLLVDGVATSVADVELAPGDVEFLELIGSD